MRNNKLLGAAALSAALLGGGVVGALFGTPALSLAQESDDPTTSTAPAGEGEGKGQGEGDHPFRRHGGHGCFAKAANLDAAAEALDLSEDDLHDALRDGNSIAEVAEEQNVDLQTVIDAMAAAANARIDDAVADGDLDEERAAELKEDLPDRITEMVNREPGLRHRHRMRGGPLRQ